MIVELIAIFFSFISNIHNLKKIHDMWRELAAPKNRSVSQYPHIADG